MLLSIFLNLCYGFSNLSLSGTGHLLCLHAYLTLTLSPVSRESLFPPLITTVSMQNTGRLDIQLRLGQFLKQAR